MDGSNTVSRDPGGVTGIQSNDILYDTSGVGGRTGVFGVDVKDIYRKNIVVLVVSLTWVRYFVARRFC